MSTAPQSASIISFRDAVGLAMALADEYAFANGLAVVNRSGEVVDLALLEGIGKTIEPLVRWIVSERAEYPRAEDPRAEYRRAGYPRAAYPSGESAPDSAILLSIRPYEVDLVREEDLRLYRYAGWAVAAAGLHLVDWIETDGDLFRSYAYLTCPTLAWQHDPPAERQRW